MSSLFERIKSAIPKDGLQIASYKVIRQIQDYEERIYPPQTWVRTQIKSTSREDCTYPMFWKLFNYISGQNERQEKIPMTAPVSVLVEPDDPSEAADYRQNTFTMAFYIPAPFDEDPPQPNDPSVSIEHRPEIRVLVRTYGGFSNDRIDQEERCHLLASLTAEDREMVQDLLNKPGGGVYYCAGYDPPLKLFFRRNEIWLPIQWQNDNSGGSTISPVN
ncbi:hypothetical protein OUZ56_009211 [Daphnia magna]|uniref:Heme-binding protein n=1 Tax=Daphnia magna TaxID=35525 RepID=A0ABR0AFB6_9CRUS|nr:hypothetical protein OUZ56_009211 [Daphnia magna]